MKQPSAIQVENLTKRYKRQTALHRVGFEVPAGSVFGLLGENGAGKTTTIQALLGLVRPDEGRVRTLGLDPSAHGLDVRRLVGYVPEQHALYDWMTVREIGWFASGFHPDPSFGTAPFRQRYEALIEGYGLPPRRKIRQLSKGMKAKVSLALALASEPDLLILDEPTSGLDVLVRREFLESMVDLAGEGRTVLLSSHQIAEVERVASHVALLHRGHLLLAEPLDELRARTFVLSVVFAGHARMEGPPAGLGIELLDAEESPRQARWVVHAPDRVSVEALRSLPAVEGLEVATPSLEEIYIAYMRGRRPDSPTPPLKAHVA